MAPALAKGKKPIAKKEKKATAKPVKPPVVRLPTSKNPKVQVNPMDYVSVLWHSR